MAQKQKAVVKTITKKKQQTLKTPKEVRYVIAAVNRIMDTCYDTEGRPSADQENSTYIDGLAHAKSLLLQYVPEKEKPIVRALRSRAPVRIN